MRLHQEQNEAQPGSAEQNGTASLMQKNASSLNPTFCVAMLKNGNTIKVEGRISDFLKTINEADFSWINVQVDDLKADALSISSMLGFNPAMADELLLQRFSGYVDEVTELGLLLPAVHVHNLEVEINKLLVLMRPNLIATIHSAKVTRLVKFARYATTSFKKIPKHLKPIDKISSVLVRILDENNERNFDGIRAIQEQGEKISEHLIEFRKARDNLGTDIYKMKHALITYLETLWAGLDVVHYLRYGDADAITDDPFILRKISMLSNDLTRQISISEQMSAVLASGLEVLQSIYNNQLQVLNNRLSSVVVWLTILGTAVLVPNTIATIFGIGPIAEHVEWHQILITLIIATVVATFGMYWYVRKKGLLQTKVD